MHARFGEEAPTHLRRKRGRESTYHVLQASGVLANPRRMVNPLHWYSSVLGRLLQAPAEARGWVGMVMRGRSTEEPTSGAGGLIYMER